MQYLRSARRRRMHITAFWKKIFDETSKERREATQVQRADSQDTPQYLRRAKKRVLACSRRWGRGSPSEKGSGRLCQGHKTDKKAGAAAQRSGREFSESAAFGSKQHHDLVEVSFLCLILYREPVDDRQNAAASAGQKLQNTHTGLLQHKTIHAERAEEKRYQ